MRGLVASATKWKEVSKASGFPGVLLQMGFGGLGVCVCDVCADSNCHFYLCNGVIESEESDAESSNSVENRSIDCANPLTGVFGVEVVTGFVAGVRFSPL